MNGASSPDARALRTVCRPGFLSDLCRKCPFCQRSPYWPKPPATPAPTPAPTPPPCEVDIKSQDWCMGKKEQGKCSKAGVQKKCHATCNSCRPTCKNSKGDAWCQKKAARLQGKEKPQNLCDKKKLAEKHCRKECHGWRQFFAECVV